MRTIIVIATNDLVIRESPTVRYVRSVVKLHCVTAKVIRESPTVRYVSNYNQTKAKNFDSEQLGIYTTGYYNSCCHGLLNSSHPNCVFFLSQPTT